MDKLTEQLIQSKLLREAGNYEPPEYSGCFCSCLMLIFFVTPLVGLFLWTIYQIIKIILS